MSTLQTSSIEVGSTDMKPLRGIIECHEDWLINRILDYAKKRNYVKYTSVLAEAWRMSIAGLSAVLLQAMEKDVSPPELGPDDDYTADASASFGILEAQKHRSRGITISMFLGLMKYYRQSYLDLLSEAELSQSVKEQYLLFIRRCFDRIELGFISEWCSQPSNLALSDLQSANRAITNEKNLYLTLFENIPDPVIMFNAHLIPFTANKAALSHFDNPAATGQAYSHQSPEQPLAFPEWVNALGGQLSPDASEASFERVITNNLGSSYYEVQLKRVEDISGKFSGMLAILKDVTRRHEAEEGLKKSEAAFRSIFEGSRDAMMLLDNGGFFDCNKSTLDIFRCPTKEQFVTKHLAELSPPQQPNERDSVAAAKEHIEAAYREGIRFFEWQHRRLDGPEFPAEVLLSRFELNGKTVLQAVVRDITERKRTELSLYESREALQQQHEKLGRMFTMVEIGKREWEKTMDCIDDMVILTDMQGHVKRCNKSFQGFVNKPYDRLLGSDCIELLIERGIEVKEFLSKETEIYHKPGNRWFRISAYPASGIDGAGVSGTVMTIHDITDVKLMTQKLEQTNAEIEASRLSLRHALNELSSLIRRVENEQAFNVRFANPHLKKCYELKKCSKTECPCYGKDASRCWQIAGTHCGCTIQGVFAQKYGNCVKCDVYKTAASNPIFEIGEQFNNMMNILEHKNNELETAYSELKLSQAKILQQEKMASIGQLAAGVAHEINNPIGFVSSNLGTLDKYLSRLIEYAGILATVAGDLHDLAIDAHLADERKRLKIDSIIDDARKLIVESRDGTHRVKTIVQNLKSFSRVDQQQALDADINECLETTLNIVWNELKYKVTVKKEYGVLPRTWCYPQQLNQVFMNLLMNAAQAIEKQGTIAIRTWATADSLYASIADTGCGITAANISRIFEPFFTTKEVGKGTGLGLSITYDIIKNHNGDITVESEVGKGTTFTVRVPIRENDGATPHQEAV